MTRRNEPTIFRDNPHNHFNPKWQKAEVERKAHERGQENKIRWEMGKRKSIKTDIECERHSVAMHAAHAPVTLATVKWMKP